MNSNQLFLHRCFCHLDLIHFQAFIVVFFRHFSFEPLDFIQRLIEIFLFYNIITK